jgi:hypothetical protein
MGIKYDDIPYQNFIDELARFHHQFVSARTQHNQFFEPFSTLAETRSLQYAKLTILLPLLTFLRGSEEFFDGGVDDVVESLHF